ncbi:MAG: uroporphyrinogen decarboxylase family protein [Armatimonadota bacterium]
MTKFERIQAAIRGEAVDRVPYSLWYHFRLNPPAGETLANAELEFHAKYDPDLLKVMHDIPYEMSMGMASIHAVEDWAKLPVLPPDKGNFAEQLAALRIIQRRKNDDAPMVDTVFNVFAYAQKISQQQLLNHLRQNPEAVRVGLERIAQSLAGYAKKLVEEGIGVYLAVAGASADLATPEEYARDFLPLDEMVLDSAQGAAVNVLHIHGENIYFDLLLPLASKAHVLSWSNRITAPSIPEARLKYTGCIMAGVDEVNIKSLMVEQVKAQVRETIEQTRGRGVIVAPGCAVPTDTPPELLLAIREAVLEAGGASA